MRIILDTNLWSRIGDESSVRHLNQWAFLHDIELVTPPAILMEMIRVSRRDLLEKWVLALTTGRRVRLPSEAELESNEIVAEVRRTHPQWLRRWPDTGLVSHYNTFWTKTVWRSAKENLSGLTAGGATLSDPEDKMLEIQRQNQQGLQATRADWTKLDVWATLTDDAPAELRQGWPNHPVEGWRANAAMLFWHQLHNEPIRAIFSKNRATYADWIGAYVHLPSMLQERATFNGFWLHEVEVVNLPRQWLRYAVDVAQIQAQKKPQKSNFRDNQLAAYLLNCDVFATADVAFANALQLVRDAAPFSLCDIRLIRLSQAESTVEALMLQLTPPSPPSQQ